MVLILIADMPAGTGVLVHSRGRLLILTADHILWNDDGTLRTGQLSFSMPHGAPSTQLRVPWQAVARNAENDAAVVDLSSLHWDFEHDVEKHLQAATLQDEDLFIIHPHDAQMRRVTVHISGFPSERSWIDETGNYVSPFTYSSAAPPSGLLKRARREYPVNHLVWMPPDGNKHVDTLEDAPRPVLSGASGGPWFLVQEEPSGPRLRLIAIHSHRRPFSFKSTTHEVAVGIPLFAYSEFIRLPAE